VIDVHIHFQGEADFPRDAPPPDWDTPDRGPHVLEIRSRHSTPDQLRQAARDYEARWQQSDSFLWWSLEEPRVTTEGDWTVLHALIRYRPADEIGVSRYA
jgi:hypothetical protein